MRLLNDQVKSPAEAPIGAEGDQRNASAGNDSIFI